MLSFISAQARGRTPHSAIVTGRARGSAGKERVGAYRV